MRTGFSPAHTAKANCRTGQVRSTRRTWSQQPRKSESWVTSAGTRSDIRTREGCARANATCKHLSHSEHLRASDHANQARCAEPSCELVARQKRRKTKHRGLSDVNGRTKFWRGFASG